MRTSHSGGGGRGGTEQLLSRSCNSLIHSFIHFRHGNLSVNPSPCNSKYYSEKSGGVKPTANRSFERVTTAMRKIKVLHQRVTGLPW